MSLLGPVGGLVWEIVWTAVVTNAVPWLSEFVSQRILPLWQRYWPVIYQSVLVPTYHLVSDTIQPLLHDLLSNHGDSSAVSASESPPGGPSPNMLVVDMEKFVAPQPESWFSVDELEPAAYALVEVIEAADMKPSDLNGLADPYVKGQLGPYRFRTITQKKTLAPKWGEEFKVPVFTWESPNVLDIEVYDKDHFVDDALGDCSIKIVELRDGQRHDMWLPLQNIKMGRLHLAITVVEGNKKASDQSFDIGTPNDNKENISLANDNGIPGMTPKVADIFEPIDIEGQEETGIWVHHPGSEVPQVWEPRKGKSKLVGAPILITGSFKSTVTGSNPDDGSSSDESEEGNDKGNRPNKVQRGLNKIGSLLQSRVLKVKIRHMSE